MPSRRTLKLPSRLSSRCLLSLATTEPKPRSRFASSRSNRQGRCASNVAMAPKSNPFSPAHRPASPAPSDTPALERRRRANPAFELVLFDRLPAAERRLLDALTGDPEHYGVLRPA